MRQVLVRAGNRHGKSDPVYLLVETRTEPIKKLAETKVLYCIAHCTFCTLLSCR